MSESLVDLRAKLTPRTHQTLTAVARAANRNLAGVVREMLDLWADQRIHEATLIRRLTAGEGNGGENGGR